MNVDPGIRQVIKESSEAMGNCSQSFQYSWSQQVRNLLNNSMFPRRSSSEVVQDRPPILSRGLGYKSLSLDEGALKYAGYCIDQSTGAGTVVGNS